MIPRRHENPVIICTGFAVSGWSAAKPYVLFIAIDLAPALLRHSDGKMPQFSV